MFILHNGIHVRKYEIVTSGHGICLGISVGTVYTLENKSYLCFIKLYNLLYLPRKESFSRKMVTYFESLNLMDLSNTYYSSKKEIFDELESIGVVSY